MTKACIVCRYSRMFIISCAMLCSVSFSASAEPVEESNIYMTIDSFTWREFDDAGSRILKESGPILGAGFRYWKEFPNRLTLSPAAEIFGGIVDYDGQACSINFVTHVQTCLPATTNVDYFGFKLQADLGGIFRPEQTFYVEPFAGIGFRYWLRNINDGTDVNGNPTAGYLEEWLTLHARLGVRGGVDLSAKKQLFAEAGVKLPLFNQNTAYRSSAGGFDVTLNPGKQASFFAEAGMKIRRFKASLFYDSMRFPKSNIVVIPIQTSSGPAELLNWQPRSTMDMYGLKLGLVF